MAQPSRIRQHVALFRLNNAVFPVLSVIAAYAVGGGNNNLQIAVAIVVTILANSAMTVWNDIDDMEVDAANGRPYIQSIYRSRDYYNVVLLLVLFIVAAFIIGYFFLPLASVGLLAVTMLLGWMYNSPPLQASRRPIASVLFLSLTGAFFPFLIGLSLGSITVFGLWFAVWWWLSRASLSILKDYKDAQGDMKHKKKTFLLVYGGRRVGQVSILLFFVGTAGVVAQATMIAVQWVVLPTVAIAAFLLFERRGLLLRSASYQQLNTLFQRVAFHQILFDTVVITWLIYS